MGRDYLKVDFAQEHLTPFGWSAFVKAGKLHASIAGLRDHRTCDIRRRSLPSGRYRQVSRRL